ncbi:MAG: LysR family transcriptional regulator [Rhodobacteraceae bacterium]|nr:LysR family transcriptional regulator [Paracoccaceae bacterium]
MYPTRASFPNITLLRQFVEVAREEGIARAARSLGISQPALSKNLRRLEETVGAALIDRHTKGTALTPAGQALYQRALKIILEYEHALQEVQNTLTEDAGILRIGAGAVFSSTLIPAAIPRFQAHYPNYRVSVQARAVEDTREDLELGRVDIVASVIHEQIDDALFQRPIRRANLVILCAATHPLAALPGPAPLANLARHPFVSFRPDHDLIRKLALILAENDAPPPRYTVETSSIFGASEMVRGGEFLMYGSSLLTDYAIGKGLVALRTEVPLGDYTMGFLLLKGRELVPAYRGFMNVVQQEAVRIPPAVA